METDYLQKLKKRLDNLLNELPIDSPEILGLSCEIDNLIVEYYERELYN